MKINWQSFSKNPIINRIIIGFLVALATFLLTYTLYYQKQIDLMQDQISGVNEQVAVAQQQVAASNAWQHYNGFRDAIYEKWYYLCSESDPAIGCSYDWDFREISDHCEKIREEMESENWSGAWRSVEEGYIILQKLPGPLYVEEQR